MKNQNLKTKSRKEWKKLLSCLSGAALLSGAILGSNARYAQLAPSNPKQNPLWLMSNNTNYASTKHNQFKFYYNGSPVIQNTPTGSLTNQYGSTATHIFNSMPDNQGNLNFYVGLYGG